MVHKKYIEKDGKKYGPYLYESYRDKDGRVKKRYIHSSIGDDFLGRVKIFLGVFLCLALFFLIFQSAHHSSYSPDSLGRVTASIDPVYKLGDRLSGELKFNLREGELIPQTAKVILRDGTQSKELQLSDVSVKAELANGNFYAEGVDLSGSGTGYGVMGKKVTRPEVDFQLLVGLLDTSNEEQANDSENGSAVESGNESASENEANESSPIIVGGNGGSEDSIEVPADSVPSTSTTETSTSESVVSPASESGESSTSTESSSDSGSSAADSGNGDGGVTGNVLIENAYTYSGKVVEGNDFEYSLEEGQYAELVPGSVRVNGKQIEDSRVSIRVVGNKVIVSTDYDFIEDGFGEAFLGDYKLLLNIDLAAFDMNLRGDELNLSLSYQGKTIASARKNLFVETKNINLSFIKEIPTIRISKGKHFDLNLNDYFEGANRYVFTAKNVSVREIGLGELEIKPESGFNGASKAIVYAYSDNGSVKSNEFNILVSSSAVSITTSREKIRVGEPVKWKTVVTSDSSEKLSISLPMDAEGVAIKKISGEDAKVSSNLVSSGMTGNVVLQVDLKKDSLFVGWIKKLFRSMTGNVVSTPLDEGIETQELTLDVTPDKSLVIEYETPAPTSTERVISGGKEVVVSGPNDVEYTDVIASATFDKLVEVGKENLIKVYWDTDVNSAKVKNVKDVYDVSTGGAFGGKKVSAFGGKISMPFDAYDLNGDGWIDYVEWVVPHLSEQHFQIITKTSVRQIWTNGDRGNEDVSEVVSGIGGGYATLFSGSDDYIQVVFNRELVGGDFINVVYTTTGGLRICGAWMNECKDYAGGSAVTLHASVSQIASTVEDTFNFYDIGGDANVDYISAIDSSSCQPGWVGANCNLAANGGYCTGDGECASGHCNGGLNICLANDGENCAYDTDCFSNYCDAGYCSNVCNRVSCGDNEICNVTDGSCVCDTGYHNGGDGVCVAVGSCSMGYDDGGDGTCLDYGTCSPGYYFDELSCVALINNGQSCDLIISPPSLSCKSGICNSNNICGNETGQECSDDSQCISGACGAGVPRLCTDGKLGNRCFWAGNCSASYFCDTYNDAVTCTRGVTGVDRCNSGAECASGICNTNNGANICSAGILNDFCSSDSECNFSAGFNCSNQNHVCTDGAVGHSCIREDACAGPAIYCSSGTYTCTNGESGVDSCYSGVECASGMCGSNRICGGDNGQGPCTVGSQCQSGICNILAGNVCGGDLTNGISCNYKWECASGICSTLGNVCSAGALGDGCSVWEDCASDLCGTDNKCGGIGAGCDGDFDCFGPLYACRGAVCGLEETPPSIEFTSNTPADSSTQEAKSIFVETTSSESYGDHYVLNNFDNSLKGYWRGESNIVDDSGNGNTGSWGGAADETYVTGKFGNAFGFDGAVDYVSLTPSTMSANMSRTYSMWVYAPSAPSDPEYSQVLDFRTTGGKPFDDLIIQDADQVYASYSWGIWGDCSATGIHRLSTPLANYNVWHHIALTVNSTGTRTVYLDGVAGDSYTYSLPSCTSSGITLAYNPILGSKYFNGSIDEVVVFNRSLSASEVKALYDASLNQYSNTFAGLSNGAHTFQAFAVDYAGNLGNTELRTVTVSGPVEVSGCRTLNEPGIYNLTGNIPATGNCLIVSSNNVIINGNGYSITGNGTGNGALINGFNNSIISNLTIINFTTGVYLNGANYNNFTNINSSSNLADGIYVGSGLGNRFVNIFSGFNSGYGLELVSSSFSYISSITTINNNADGFYLDNSNNNTLTGVTSRYNNYKGIYLVSSNWNSIAGTFTNNQVGENENGDFVCSESWRNTDSGIIYGNQSGCIGWLNGANVIGGCLSLYYPGNYNLTSSFSSNRANCLDIQSDNIAINGLGNYINAAGEEMIIAANGHSVNLSNIEFIGEDSLIIGSGVHLTNANMTLNSNYPGSYPAKLHRISKNDAYCSECYNFTALASSPAVPGSCVTEECTNFGGDESTCRTSGCDWDSDSFVCSGGTNTIDCVSLNQSMCTVDFGGYCIWNAEIPTTSKFNISSAGNYTIKKIVLSQTNISLDNNNGWNMFSIDTVGNATGDVNISLNEGWNLIGYSADTAVAHTALTYTASPTRSMSEAAVNGSIQYQFGYYDGANKKFKYAPRNDNSLREGRAYWVYANRSGELTVPGAGSLGGAAEDASYAWSDLMFTNGTEELNITNAYDAGWIGAVEDPSTWIYYFDDSDPDPNMHGLAYLSNANSLSPWEGYFIQTNVPNITMLRVD